MARSGGRTSVRREARRRAYRRPLLVVQCDPANRSRLATVICVAISGNVALAKLPVNVLLEPPDTGLPGSSVVNVSQVVTMDKGLLEERVARLPDAAMDRVEAGLRRMLDLW